MKTGLDHFGILAPFYEKFIKPNPPERLLALADLEPAGNVLDMGGGTGRVAIFLTGKAKQVFIADESMGMLKEAKKKESLIPMCGKSEGMPLGKESIDRIIMVDALHHVQNQKATADELWRLVKPGGRIVIEEPDIRKFAVKLVALFEKLAMMRSHFLDAREMTGLFEEKGAEIRSETEGHTVWVVVEKKQRESNQL